ncbi:MAG: RNA methyltransferase [Actinomycetaceae bacterium]|nr:RNA methyltransferase [Actinomycetaceae bacterium]MDY6083145.1 RNA methyltransferase [Actinomycetaceae bacterium]
MEQLKVKPASRSGLQRASRLTDRRVRDKYQQFLVEGPAGVREILRWQPDLVRDFFYQDDVLKAHPDIAELARAAQVWAHPVGAQDAHAMSSASQGLFIVAHMPERSRLEDVLMGTGFVMAAAQMQDPGNLGTLIRSTDAAGGTGVIVGQGSVDYLSPKVVRSSAGSLFHLPIAAQVDVDSLVEAAHRHRYQVFAADAHGNVSLTDLVTSSLNAKRCEPAHGSFDLRRPTVWIVGNEAHGFLGHDLGNIDAVVSVPLIGRAESLNAAMSSVLLAYASALSHM